MEKSHNSRSKQIEYGGKYIAPSILSANFWNLKRDITTLKELDCKILHLDVMDGHFVPNLSFGIPVIKSVRKHTDMILDVHLMIENPETFAEKYIEAGADMISFHQEVCYHKDRLINFIKGKGVKCGIVLNPATPINQIETILPILDFVLLMSVNPGFGGQTFIPYVLEKIKKLNTLRKKMHLNFFIEVDGGVSSENIKSLLLNGVDIFVAGSAIFKGDIENNYKKLHKILKEEN